MSWRIGLRPSCKRRDPCDHRTIHSGHSWLHTLDARAKTLFILLFIPVVFLADNLWTNVFLLAFTLFAVKLSQLSWRYLWNGLRMILFLIIFTLLLQLFFNRDGDLLVSFGPFAIYSEGIRMGLIVSLRFFYLVMLTTLVTLTTTPMELTDSIEAGLRPLERFKVPAHEIASCCPSLFGSCRRSLTRQTES